MLVAKATRLICDRKPYIIELENGARISTRTIVIATVHNIESYLWKTCPDSKVQVFITVRPLWKRSCVEEKK
jgi:hypothetical protein